MSTDPESRHAWDDAYAPGSQPPWDIGRPQPALRRLADAGALDGDLLDVGCGSGEHAILAACCGARALGVDLSALAIARARRKAAERRVDAAFAVLDARTLGSLAGRFETVVDSGLFHVFDDADRLRYVEALGAATRPGGHLHLMCFSDQEPGDWGPRRVTERELRAAFGTGWRVESLARDRFEVHLPDGPGAAQAWLLDAVRLSSD